MLYNVTAETFTQRNFAAHFLPEKYTFRGKIANLRCWIPFGSLEATYAVHLRLIGKLVVHILLVMNELLFSSCKGWSTTSELEIAVFEAWGHIDPKFHVEADVPTNHYPCWKTRWIVFSYGVKMRAEVSFVLSQFTHLIDRRTVRQTDTRRQQDGGYAFAVALNKPVSAVPHYV